jgi:hypothetical protein
MKMEKEAKLKSLSFGVKVRQRTKKDPITIEGSIPVKKGNVIQSQNTSSKKRGKESIKLKLRLSPDDWQKLWSCCLKYPDKFMLGFWSDILYPAMQQLETKKGTRGEFKVSKFFIEWLKTEASFLYVFFSHWPKISFDEWPDYLKKLVEKAKKEGWEEDIIFKGKYYPRGLTDYCIITLYGERCEKHGLNPLEDPFNLYKTYIQDKVRTANIAEFFFKDKTTEQVSQLAYEQPLLRIFKILGIMPAQQK